jgi:hypothetical protein
VAIPLAPLRLAGGADEIRPRNDLWPQVAVAFQVSPPLLRNQPPTCAPTLRNCSAA